MALKEKGKIIFSPLMVEPLMVENGWEAEFLTQMGLVVESGWKSCG